VQARLLLMYPTLSKLISSIYSICFPLDLTVDYSKELVKKREAIFAKIERAENEGRSLTFSIKDILDLGIKNLQPLNLSAPTLTYIKQTIQKIIAYYAEHFVFYTPSFYYEEDSTSFVLQYFLPALFPLIDDLTSKLNLRQELPTLPTDWFLASQNMANSPFATVLKTIITAKYGSQRKAFITISSATGRQADSVRSSIRRWIQGTSLPKTIYDCLQTLGLKESASHTEKTLLYFAIILSKYYGSIQPIYNINDSLVYIKSHGESDYHNKLLTQEPSYLIAPILLSFAFHNRNMIKKDPGARTKFELFLENDSIFITELKLMYLENTVWGRYFTIIENRLEVALGYYMRAFEEGKYKAGLFQRQICNETLHCASTLGKHREFNRVFRWSEFSDRVFQKKMGYAEMSEEEAFDFFKHNPDNTLYRLHGDEFTISVLKNLVG